MNKNISFKYFTGLNEVATLIRKKVFIDEQCYIVDIDDEDKTATHFIEYYKNTPVGTCRIIKKDNNSIKIGRFAILEEYRNKNLGKELLDEVEKYAKENNYKKIYLDAQFDKRGFYFKSGYKVLSDKLFLDENYPHIHLYKDL